MSCLVQSVALQDAGRVLLGSAGVGDGVGDGVVDGVGDGVGDGDGDGVRLCRLG